MTAPLSGQAALITGGGTGIGLACAKALHADGAHVTLAGRREEVVKAAAAALGERTSYVQCDVASESDVVRAVEAAAEPLGGLHLAVLAAGTGVGGPLTMVPIEMWQACMDTNLTGAFLCIKHAGTAMVAAGGGAIVALSSIAAPLTHRMMTPYCVSKAALEALVKGAADELWALSGVRVNAVRPGLVPTDLATPLAANEGIVADYIEQMPLGRLGTVEDIAAGVRYLCGPESSWVTGQCYAIDGGHTLRRGPDVTRAT